MDTFDHNGRPYLLQRIEATEPQSTILCEKGKNFCPEELYILLTFFCKKDKVDSFYKIGIENFPAAKEIL